MSDVYKCRKCNQKTLFVEDMGNYVEGKCTNCGYSFTKQKKQRFGTYVSNLLGTVNKFSFIISVILIIVMIVSLITVSEQIRLTSMKIDDLDNYTENKLTIINENISSIETNIGSVKANIEAIFTRLSNAESSISNLNLLYGDVTNIKGNLTNIENNISSLWTNVNSLSSVNMKNLVDINVTCTSYANQTGYCHYDISVKHKSINIQEVRFGIYCEKTNITLMNWTGYAKPQEYQWVNGTYHDNYNLYWFGLNDNCTARFNVSWSLSDYNSTNLTLANMTDTLMVNSVLVDTPEVWKIENA